MSGQRAFARAASLNAEQEGSTVEHAKIASRLKFGNAAFAFSVVFVVLQQVIVASSTFFIAELGRAVASGGEYAVWLGLFIGSLVLALVPTIIWNYFLNTAKYRALDEFVGTARRALFNHPHLYYSEKFRTERQSYFTHDAWVVIQQTYDFAADFLSTATNVVLTSLVLGYLLSFEFALAYGVALLFAIASFRVGRRVIEKRSAVAQDDRNRMLQLLAQGLDCILVGNTWSDSVWRRGFSGLSTRAKEGSRRAQLTVDGVSLLTTLSSMTPILLAIGWAFSQNIGNPGALGVLVATLPRQVTTVQYLGQVVFYGAQWTDTKTRIQGIERSVDVPESEEQYAGSISWGSLHLEDEVGAVCTIKGYDDIVTGTRDFDKGRYTLRGPNGSGKTTLLTSIKERLGEHAFLLPAHERLAFEWKGARESSTGQGLMENLRELAQSPALARVKVLLLDEWDANLDQANLEHARRAIESLQREICVVEVRHRA